MGMQVKLFRARAQKRDLISEAKKHFGVRYCAQCGRKLVYARQEIFYDESTGKPNRTVYIFACPISIRLWFLNPHHDEVHFSSKVEGKEYDTA